MSAARTICLEYCFAKVGRKAHPSARKNLIQRIKHGFFPVFAGTALFLSYPSLVAYQDMATLAKMEAGIDVPAPSRWLASISEMPGISKIVAKWFSGSSPSQK